MKLFRVWFVPAVLACGFLFALSKGSALAAPAPKPVPPADMRKMIQSVDKAGSSVVIVYMDNKQTHTYRIDDFTALKVNGVPGKIDDIKTGMEVRDYTERDNDDLDALTLTGYGGDIDKPAKKK